MYHTKALFLRYSSKFTGECPVIWGANLPPCAIEPRPTYNALAYFKNKEELQYYLNRWSTNGWEYFTTKEDVFWNDRAKPVSIRETESLEGVPCWLEEMKGRAFPV